MINFTGSWILIPNENQKSNGLFQLRAQEGQTIKEETLHTMINDN